MGNACIGFLFFFFARVCVPSLLCMRGVYTLRAYETRMGKDCPSTSLNRSRSSTRFSVYARRRYWINNWLFTIQLYCVRGENSDGNNKNTAKQTRTTKPSHVYVKLLKHHKQNKHNNAFQKWHVCVCVYVWLVTITTTNCSSTCTLLSQKHSRSLQLSDTGQNRDEPPPPPRSVISLLCSHLIFQSILTV